ncbi:hypothetical protein HN031_13880 [Nocardioides sp. zg-1308]|uniref:hypothetical protein n=1 Tax=Nocardioides sp. zg-1308 TaxID=2736253 RepID=UPI0015554BC9|nr:hypothetical protein [Nocardioides sp. zg-1308]NPD05776.1 hypothetical protein [Nocardioides sp. zg-1308]
MTSDLDTTTDDLYETIRGLWREAQQGDAAAPDDTDATAVGVPDTAVAERTGLELGAVREFLDNADGVKFAVARDGETRTVTALLD